MLYTVAMVLIALWLLGLVNHYTFNGLIDILLVVAVGLILVKVVGGRNRT